MGEERFEVDDSEEIRPRGEHLRVLRERGHHHVAPVRASAVGAYLDLDCAGNEEVLW